ncbi:hypothetical protein OBV_22690 [Oscillibacter valericigenes Sjm18-20]|nr:hypothetical protein OBV_22690 [Oscillibacter valericigenes Sjm18-20]
MTMKRLVKAAVLAAIGGLTYYGIEWIYKTLVSGGRTHWSMAVIGGVMFLLIGSINEFIPWEMPLLLQGIIGSVAITAVELLAGIYLNLFLKLGIWDYSRMPFNLWGQICLPFSLIWVLLSVVAVILDDWVRYFLWGEVRPHYTVF